MKGGWIVGLAFFGLSAATPPPTADEIVRRSLANTQADWHAAPVYDYTERDLVPKGRGGTKTYRVRMIDGSTYNELTAVDGKPLGADEAQQQEDKLREEIAKRQHETPAERQHRVSGYERERRQDQALLREMTKAFDFRIEGEDSVAGRRCFVLVGTPKPGYEPISRDTKVLKGMRGKLWVDEQQYQWVKVQAEVFRPVAFGLFIANVEPGTRFMLEQTPVKDGLWLPSHFTVTVKAKVLRVLPHNSVDDETYSNYRPASQDHPATASNSH